MEAGKGSGREEYKSASLQSGIKQKSQFSDQKVGKNRSAEYCQVPCNLTLNTSFAHRVVSSF